MSGGSQQPQGGAQPWQGYQGQRSNVNPWSGYTPAQAYPGLPMQNFLNLYQYPPFSRAWFTNQPQSAPIPPTGGTGTAPTAPPGAPPPYTGIPTQNTTTPSGTPVYGTPTNTPTQNQQAAAEMGNPLPPPGTVSGYGGAQPIQNPVSTPQSVFNDILSKYGQNAAMTFALHNRGLMGNIGIEQLSGLPSVDRNRMVNTYAAGTNDAGGDYQMDLSALGNPFDPTSAISRYRAQLTPAYSGTLPLGATNLNTLLPGAYTTQ